MTAQVFNQVTNRIVPSKQIQGTTISEDKLIDAISKVNADQIEDIATIVAGKTIFWLENQRDLGEQEKKKMFQFEYEYDSLKNLIKPILVAEITDAFSTPSKFIKDGLDLLITNPNGEGLFDPIENTPLREMLKSVNQAHSGIVSFMLFQHLNKKTHDLKLNAFITIYDTTTPLYSIYDLETKLI